MLLARLQTMIFLSQLLCTLSPALVTAAETEAERIEINTALMRSTFKIAGPKSLGTVFLIGRPITGDDKNSFIVLVTAAHVLRDIPGEQALLFLRKKQGPDFIKLPYTVQIRKAGKALWKEHPKADIAVMYVRIPKEADIQVVPMSFLADDDVLEKYEIHPGDVLSALGYPYGAEANEAGFPILRSGQIASYPLMPTRKVQSFLLDFRVFGGNSGGPVYFAAPNRTVGTKVIMGNISFLAGLVSQETLVEEEIQSLTESRRVKYPLSLAVVIHASLIRESINLLPERPD